MRAKEKAKDAKDSAEGMNLINQVRLEAMIKELQRQVQEHSNNLANARADVAQANLMSQAKDQELAAKDKEIAELQKQIAGQVVAGAKRKR